MTWTSGLSLYLRFLRYDTRFFNLVSATIAVCWWVWALITPVPLFPFLVPSSASHLLFSQIFPQPMLIVLFGLYGLGSWISFLCEWSAVERQLLLLGVFLWSILAWALLLTGQYYPSMGTYSCLALACGWSFVRTA